MNKKLLLVIVALAVLAAIFMSMRGEKKPTCM